MIFERTIRRKILIALFSKYFTVKYLFFPLPITASSKIEFNNTHN